MTEERSRTPRRVPVPTHVLDNRTSTRKGPLCSIEARARRRIPISRRGPRFWRDQRAGLISIAEAQRRSAAIGGAGPYRLVRPQGAGQGRGRAPPPVARPRHERPRPTTAVSTRAADGDDRRARRPPDAERQGLSPGAAGALRPGPCPRRSPRAPPATSCRARRAPSGATRRPRVRFGYVELEILRNGGACISAFTVKLTALVAPFYEEARGLARWLAETPPRPNSARSTPSSIRHDRDNTSVTQKPNPNHLLLAHTREDGHGPLRGPAKGF